MDKGEIDGVDGTPVADDEKSTLEHHIKIDSEVINSREELDEHLRWMFDVGEPL